MILKVYNEDQDEDEINSHLDNDSDEAPELITSREDFGSMVNEFLNDFEIVGRKMKPKLEGESGPEKLDVLRRAMGQDERVRISNDGNEEDDIDDLISSDEEDKKDRWDCETILCVSLFSVLLFKIIIASFQQLTQTLRTTPVSSAFLIQSQCQRLLLIPKQVFLPSLILFNTRRRIKSRSL
jgi:hypothetical protein